MGLTDAPALAKIPGRFAAAPQGARIPALSPFAHCEVFDDLAAARDPWSELQALEIASPYQDYFFLDAWLRTVGAARAIKPMIVVARDPTGRVNAVLPLGRTRRGPVWTAEFLGGGDANFKMGLFRPGETTRESVTDLLERAARMVDPPIDLFWLADQPFSWRGAANPMAALRRRPSPSFGHKTALRNDFEGWFKAHYSKDSRKKLRKKADRLDEIGRVEAIVAHDQSTARDIVAAFLNQKAARVRMVGMANAFGSPQALQFLDAIAVRSLGHGRPAVEMHALLSGGRVVATFGGLTQGDRFCGMFISYETEQTIARCSPGRLLVLEAIKSLCARGFATFDLGVGEAPYKDANCEADEPLFDAAVPVTIMGLGFGAAVLEGRRIKRWIKQTPWAWSLAVGLRRRVSWLRGAAGLA